MSVSFLRPSVGKIVLDGSALKSGKTINYCEAVVLNEADEVTAKSSGTFMLRRWHINVDNQYSIYNDYVAKYNKKA